MPGCNNDDVLIADRCQPAKTGKALML